MQIRSTYGWPIVGVLVAAFGFASPGRAERERGGGDLGRELTLAAAIGIALDNSPDLRASAYHFQAAASEAQQARLLPNPTLEGEVENIAGRGEFSGTDAAEYTVMLSQPLPLGGKRSTRARVADLERELAAWRHESARRHSVAHVALAFNEVLAAGQQLALADESLGLAEELVENAARRVKAGGASELELTKARIERAETVVARTAMAQRVTAARRQLATLLGMSDETMPSVAGNLYALPALPSYAELKRRLTGHPDWAKWSVEVARREAEAEAAEADRLPDLDLGIGWKRLEGAADGAGADAFVVAAGLPLPLFDRRQGARQAARLKQAASTEERHAAERALQRDLAGAYSELTQAHARASALAEEILPAAESAFTLSRDGYLQGRFGYIDLLDAQRTLFETRSQHIEALRTYHQSAVSVDLLTAGSLQGTVSEREE